MTRLAFYLPEQADNFLSVKGHLERMFARKYGGFTSYHGHGGWQNPDTNEIVKEPVKIYEVFTDQHESRVMLDMKAVAYHVREETGEDSVMFAVNDEAVFVP